MNAYTLDLLAGSYAICRLQPDDDLPEWARGEFLSLTRTTEELSVVCLDDGIPIDTQVEAGWQCLRVQGPLHFGLTGVLSSLTGCLADHSISIFAVSTYDTDYILVKEESLRTAVEALTTAGHIVIAPDLETDT